jgi:hypothetical protein
VEPRRLTSVLPPRAARLDMDFIRSPSNTIVACRSGSCKVDQLAISMPVRPHPMQ